MSKTKEDRKHTQEAERSEEREAQKAADRKDEAGLGPWAFSR